MVPQKYNNIPFCDRNDPQEGQDLELLCHKPLRHFHLLVYLELCLDLKYLFAPYHHHLQLPLNMNELTTLENVRTPMWLKREI